MHRFDVLIEARFRRTLVAPRKQRHYKPAAHPAFDIRVVAQVALELEVQHIGEVQRVD